MSHTPIRGSITACLHGVSGWEGGESLKTSKACALQCHQAARGGRWGSDFSFVAHWTIEPRKKKRPGLGLLSHGESTQRTRPHTPVFFLPHFTSGPVVHFIITAPTVVNIRGPRLLCCQRTLIKKPLLSIYVKEPWQLFSCSSYAFSLQTITETGIATTRMSFVAPSLATGQSPHHLHPFGGSLPQLQLSYQHAPMHPPPSTSFSLQFHNSSPSALSPCPFISVRIIPHFFFSIPLLSVSAPAATKKKQKIFFRPKRTGKRGTRFWVRLFFKFQKRVPTVGNRRTQEPVKQTDSFFFCLHLNCGEGGRGAREGAACWCACVFALRLFLVVFSATGGGQVIATVFMIVLFFLCPRYLFDIGALFCAVHQHNSPLRIPSTPKQVATTPAASPQRLPPPPSSSFMASTTPTPVSQTQLGVPPATAPTAPLSVAPLPLSATSTAPTAMAPSSVSSPSPSATSPTLDKRAPAVEAPKLTDVVCFGFFSSVFFSFSLLLLTVLWCSMTSLSCRPTRLSRYD